MRSDTVILFPPFRLDVLNHQLCRSAGFCAERRDKGWNNCSLPDRRKRERREQATAGDAVGCVRKHS